MLHSKFQKLIPTQFHSHLFFPDADVIHEEADIKISHSGQTCFHLHNVLWRESIKSILACLGLYPNNVQACLRRISFDICKRDHMKCITQLSKGIYTLL